MSQPIRLVGIAELLGVSQQRAHQIAEENGLPAPIAEDDQGRVWDRREVTAWAKKWRKEKAWR
jgi:predicted transcriptional regulator